MYNSVFMWVKNNLIYAPDCRTEHDQDYDNKLRKRINGFNCIAIVSDKPIASEESLVKMDLEIGGKRAKAAKVTAAPGAEGETAINRKNAVVANATGDVIKQQQVYNEPETRPIRPKQSQGTGGAKPKVSAGISKFVERAPLPRTKSKAELTHKELISQECTQKQTERIEELNRENGENDENAEVLGIPLPFRSIGERSSLTDLHNLWEQCPQPQPPLINKQLKTLQLNADQAIIMTEQVKKMKSGMERLQEIIKKFNCTEKFKQDIDFIIANVGPALAKSEEMKRSEQARDDASNKKAC